MPAQKTIPIAVVLSLLATASIFAEGPDDNELTIAVAEKALKGWELYQSKQFAARFKDGHYTDSDPRTTARDFWSNGEIARLDRDANGHFETQFLISGDKLVYVGSIGVKGTFVDVAKPYAKYQGQPVTTFDRDSQKK